MTDGKLGTRGGDARRMILDAASRLFYDDGIRAVGLDAVAAAAGVTKRTVYYYFANKDELVAAYLEVRDEVTLRALDAAADAAHEPGDRILDVFDYIEQWASTAAYRGCPFNNAVAEQGASAAVTAIARRHKQTVEHWFALQAGLGGAERADDAGAQLLVLLDGALNGAAISGTPAAATTARAMAERVLDAFGVARAPRRRFVEPAPAAEYVHSAGHVDAVLPGRRAPRKSAKR